MTEIAFALALWLVITIVTPSKLRAFLSFTTASLILTLLFFHLNAGFHSKNTLNSYEVAKTLQPESMKDITIDQWARLDDDLQAAIIGGNK